ncbi:hypothetical protein ACWDNI_16060 [Nocardia niigatensis]
MRSQPTALGWFDVEVSSAPDWDRAQIRRLAKHLGYRLSWAPDAAVIPLVDTVRAAEVDCVIIPAPTHLDALALNALLSVCDVESVLPRLSFSRWGPSAGLASTDR